MPKSPESLKKYTTEEIDMEKSRAKFDTELIRGGAELMVDEEGKTHLETTKEQKENARYKMEYLINDKEKAKQELIDFLNRGMVRSAIDCKMRWKIDDDFLKTPEVQTAADNALTVVLSAILKAKDVYDGFYEVESLLSYFNAPISKQSLELASDIFIRQLVELNTSKQWQEWFHIEDVLKQSAPQESLEKIIHTIENDYDFLGLKKFYYINTNYEAYDSSLIGDMEYRLEQKSGKKLENVLSERINQFISNIEDSELFDFNDKQKQELHYKIMDWLLKRSVGDVVDGTRGENEGKIVGKHIKGFSSIRSAMELGTKYNLVNKLSPETQSTVYGILYGALSGTIGFGGTTEHLNDIIFFIETFKIDKDTIKDIAQKIFQHDISHEKIVQGKRQMYSDEHFENFKKVLTALDVPMPIR